MRAQEIKKEGASFLCPYLLMRYMLSDIFSHYFQILHSICTCAKGYFTEQEQNKKLGLQLAKGWLSRASNIDIFFVILLTCLRSVPKLFNIV